jgi:hypothetical protein
VKTLLTLRERFDNFSRNIKPSEEHIEEATRQTDYMMTRLHDVVADDGSFELLRVLKAGSNAKFTSLMRTSDNVFDVDVGAYYSGEGASKKQLDTLLRFTRDRLREIYPQKDARDFEILNSAVRVKFTSGIKLWVDVAPIVADQSLAVDNGGWIPRDDGEWRLTSVTEHNNFVIGRTTASKKRPGPVHFNRLVRLVKWWNNRLDVGLCQPAIFCELLTARAVEDMGGVTDQWQSSLRGVYSYVVKDRFTTPIVFNDCYDSSEIQIPSKPVVVLDAVNPDNNITARWTYSTRDAYVEAASVALDITLEARSAELDDDIDDAVAFWSEVFGDEFVDLSEDES